MSLMFTSLQAAKAGLRRLATRWRVWRNPSIRRVGEGLHIGKGCRFWAAQAISFGRQCYVGKEVVIETNASIGDYALIASRVAFVGRHDHGIDRLGVPMRFGPWVGAADAPVEVRSEKVVVEDDVWIGFGAIVLSGVRIGRGAVVAAGAVVAKDVAPYAIVAGSPARVVGERHADVAVRQRHERMMNTGRFEFSERGFEHWVIAPGVDE
jgi:acetyltransferase-like isoleucine patch superfamily enzyme